MEEQDLSQEIDPAEFDTMTVPEGRVEYMAPADSSGETEMTAEALPQNYDVVIDTDGQRQRVSVTFEAVDEGIMETVIKDDEKTGERIFTGAPRKVTQVEAQEKHADLLNQALTL